MQRLTLRAGSPSGTSSPGSAARGVRNGVTAALAENTLLWPSLAIFDRIHPKRRSGEWPPLVSNPRVFAQATPGTLCSGFYSVC
jgi:hypothetical protein